MRIRMPLNRLLYVLIGTALAVGVLVSVLVRPQPRLAASQACYGACPGMTTTALSLSRPTVAYGSEEDVKFTVSVSADDPGTGVPAGSVTVESGTTILCSIRLHRGKGSCSPRARALPPGQAEIVASYAGNRHFSSSVSSQEALLVVRRSVTALSLSASRVSYGSEEDLKFTVSVRGEGPGTGVPTGSVTVESGTTILCSISLASGNGSCSPSAQALPPGRHAITAAYAGDGYFSPSASGRKSLRVR